ncbi:sulfotransferase [Campylobacter lari]|uniref:sulfotransferase family protein n=1 Tax=Campylobacter lari TaxID=201 RepID=UPI002153389C|nr:sulfotransferase family 2 domain-containing protein [Campylobacter lari]MCR6510621.1 sulfotransferase family 2 domain-containing protein [Campylobacter lari]
MFKDFHDKYKCIFIHVPKVAGSSIERVIYQTDRWLVGHVKASDYVKLDRDKFESYFSFGFVRNPYDRMVSAYHYLRRGGGNLVDETWAKENIYKYNSFEEFVLNLQNNDERIKILSWMHFVPQYKYLCDNDKNILVNFIGKFEKLDEDFKKILNILKRKDNLVHVNKSQHGDYKDYYNYKTHKIIREIYKNDFEIFDYDLEDKKYFNISDNAILNILQNKIEYKSDVLENLRLKYLTQIQNLNQNIKLKEQVIQDNLTQIQNLNQNIKLKEQVIQDNLTQIQLSNNQLSFQTKYGTAKSRIHNQLSYKLGQAMIINSKSFLGYLIMPMALLSIIILHKQEHKIYQEKIKKDPSLALPLLESYPDYQEALKLKNHLSYKLGQALVKANKTWYKGGYVKMWFEVRKLKREIRKNLI